MSTTRLGIAASFLCLSSIAGAVDGVDAVVTRDFVSTQHDRIPRFCNDPTVAAVASGGWSSSSVWSTGMVPGRGAKVSIPAGVAVTYDVSSDTEIDCIEVGDGGALRWATDRNTRLRIVNIQILPGGTLVLGSPQAPVAASVRAEIIFADVALDTAGRDPAQYGNGLHIFGAGVMHGAKLDRTFLRVARDVSAGDMSLSLEADASGWKPGDRLVVPDTRHVPFRKNHVFTSRAEEPVVSALSGAALTLSAPFDYDHYGPRDADGNVGPVELGMLPHAANLTRNIVIRSVDLSESGKDRYCLGEENFSDTDNCVTRGHVMAHARARVDVRYVAFRNLGRTTVASLDNAVFDASGAPLSVGTNQIGRYSFHAHHLAGAVNPSDSGFQYAFIGNVIEGFLKWGVTVHDAHYGLVVDNILYDGNGAAVATEDGNESFNVFARNMIVHTKAGDSEQIMEKPGRGGVFDRRALFGTTRDGFWFSGMNNYVYGNVVANAPGFAYNYNGYYLPLQQAIPNFRGADMTTDSTLQTAVPVLLSTQNEAYGATGQGLWLTWSRGCCSVSAYNEVSLFHGYRIWHVNHSGVEAYHESRNAFVDFVLRNDPSVSEQSQGGSLRFNRGLNFSTRSYENGQTVFVDVDIQGFNIGIQMPAKPEDGTAEPNQTVLVDAFLRNYVNVKESLPNIDNGTSYLVDVVFEPLLIGQVPGQPSQPTSIEMSYSVNKNTSFIDRSARTYVLNFNAVPGDDFEVFFEEQAPEYPIPPPPDVDHPNFGGCPEANLTNLRCFASYGVAIGGAVAPCIERDGENDCASAAARANGYDIKGLVFPISR